MTEPHLHVVDDDAAVRDSICLLARASAVAVRAYPSAGDFLAACGPDTAGCVIADIRMPGMSGLELQEHLRREGFAIPVVILTAHGDVAGAVRAMKGGAFDFLEKPFDPDRLMALVARALDSDRAAREERDRVAAIGERAGRLTPRERQVLDLVVAGRANKVVAIELGISERTVELHRARGMRKMGARSLPELTRMMEAFDGPAPRG